MYNRINEGSIDESDQTKIPAILSHELMDCRHIYVSLNSLNQRNFNEPVSISVRIAEFIGTPGLSPNAEKK